MTGCEMKTTRTAENLRGEVSLHSPQRYVQVFTYAAVAAKISVLEAVPCVRKMRSIAKITAKPVIHRSRSRVPET